MDIRSHTGRAAAKLLALVSVLCCVAMSSCNDLIYDDENDNCSLRDTIGSDTDTIGSKIDTIVSYKVRFTYYYNMKYADAFAHEVSYVTLYVLDTDGNVVWQKTEEGDALAEEGYMMDVDVAPGTYNLLVWAGTKDLGSFYIPESTLATDLTCTLNHSYSTDGQAYVDTDLDRLFHGWLADAEFPDEAGEHVITVDLVKDTNIFHVVLQHTSGSSVDVNKFTFTITDDNGSMDWDNSLLDDERMTYYAWYTYQGEAEIYLGDEDDEETGDETRATFGAALAELTTARLVKGHSPRLTVTNNETGKTVFSIPIIDYALLVKGYENREMSDQEYLDRQDEYDMVFFLDEGEQWEDSHIYINSWEVVLQDKTL
ncbi:MAG: FimB/Mfa2 family fimbrial subunit [Prevotellaceae bacterium]|nr:FimB/Mfa2 family fimbrial subunit [Prevotellaceae bacterium]